MNLESLKQALEQEAARKQYSPQEIRQILQRKTTDTFGIIKRNLRIELALSAAAFVGMFYLIVQDGLLESPYISAFLIIGLLFFFVLFYLIYHRLSRTKITDTSIRESLETTIRTFQRFIRLYNLGTVVLTGLAFFMGSLYAAHSQQHPFARQSEFLWLIGGLSAGLASLLYPFIRWYSKKLYGVHLRKLQAYLAELIESE